MRSGPPIQEYASWDAVRLTQRLGEVVAQLVPLHEAWWRMQGDETRTKAEAFISSTADTVTGRNKDADLATYHVTASILETRAELEALKEERNYLILLIGR